MHARCIPGAVVGLGGGPAGPPGSPGAGPGDLARARVSSAGTWWTEDVYRS